MNKKAKNELIAAITGLIMIAIGIALFANKLDLKTPYLDGSMELWKFILSVIPLAAGIVLLIIKPHWNVSRYVALAGVLTILVIIFVTATLVIKKDITVIEWILYGLLILAGLMLVFIALLAGIRKKHIKRS